MRCCLIGWGVAGSPSRAMHEAFMRACGVEGGFELCDVSERDLPALLVRLRAGGYRGCNVTMPYKATLARACDELEGDGARLSAVNTLTWEGGRLVGGNTDPIGFERALRAQGLAPQPGFRGLVLGAGGAAAAVCLALDRLSAAEITVVARSASAARALAQRVRPGAAVRVAGWSPDLAAPHLPGLSIVVNATPVGLSLLPLHPRRLPPSCTVADVRYRPQPVDLVAAAREEGCPAVDGREMLLQQGALSFERWAGIPPPLEAGRNALEAALR